MNQNKETLMQSVVECLKHSKAPMRLNEFGKTLGVRSDSPLQDVLRAALEELEQQGVIAKTTRKRYVLTNAESSEFLEGILLHENQYTSYVQTDNPLFARISIKEKDRLTALHGDRVAVSVIKAGKNKKVRGEIVEILERSASPIVGTIDYDGDDFYIIPEEEYYPFDFHVNSKKLKGAKKGDKVQARLVEWDDPYLHPEAEVVEIIGKAGVLAVEFTSIAKEFKLPLEFPEHIEKEAQKAAFALGEDELATREDLRNSLVITIDPDDAKDFDDALSLEQLPNGNYVLGVHIADVSSYVIEQTELDKEAIERGNSTYLVDRVIPMLPEVLSNNVCSLVPHQDRRTYSVFMEFDSTATLQSYRLSETVIHSKRRYTYNEVQTIIEKGTGDNSSLIIALHNLATALRTKRFKTGGIDFDTSEIRFILDENNHPVKATVKKRTDATGLVEECMLAANQAVALFVEDKRKEWRLKNPLPFVYRIHDKPDRDKISDAFSFIASYGYTTPKRNATSKQINDLLHELATVPQSSAFNSILLRSQAKAIYSTHNIGHYGLGFEYYAHFTSPIRRYPDVLVHRLLKEYSQGEPDPRRIRSLAGSLEALSDHCSTTERQSVDAERASSKLAQALMANSRIGAEFWGTVTGVTNFGVFVLLDEICADGLISYKDMNDDYYRYDERMYRAVGQKTKNEIRFGSRIKAQILNVNLHRRQIDLRYVPSAKEE